MLEIILPDKNCLKSCFGIERAFRKCMDIEGNEFLILGQLGHNKALCDYLEKRGFISINNLQKAGNKKIIIAPHGINKDDLEFLKKNKVQFIDLACPFVNRLIKQALAFEKRNYQIVIIGDKNHIEIKNVCSFLKSPIVINNKVDVKKLSLFPKVAVLAQTTQTLMRINNVLPIIKKKYKKVVYANTRCPETGKRQEEAIKLAKKADLVLVVGDNISKNANNLVDVCGRFAKSKLVQGEDDIKDVLFHEIKKVGVIASASTPSFSTDGIIKCLKKLSLDAQFGSKL